MAYEKSITAKEFLNNPTAAIKHLSYDSNELTFDENYVIKKFLFEHCDISSLNDHLGLVIEQRKKKDLSRLLCARIELLNSLEMNKKEIQGYSKYIDSYLIDIESKNILSEVEQAEAIIAELGVSPVTEEAKANAIKEYGQDLGLEIIESAEIKRKMVGYRNGAASIQLKRPFNPSMTYIEEVLTLAQFWIPRKGKIPKTAPKKEENDFFNFCSIILSTSDNKVTPESIYEKFKRYIDISYSK